MPVAEKPEIERLNASKKPYFLLFSREGCSDCKTAKPHLEGIKGRLGKKGIAVVDVKLPEDREERVKQGYSELMAKYGAHGTPFLALVEGGRVLTHTMEETTANGHKKFIKYALSRFEIQGK